VAAAVTAPVVVALIAAPMEWPTSAYFMVGIANSAPLAIDSGQRCMMLL
jgi:hypothetical protein